VQSRPLDELTSSDTGDDESADLWIIYLLHGLYRICPGRELAETAVFISIATILATYDISKALDARGEPIQPRIQFSDGIVRYAVYLPAIDRRFTALFFVLSQLNNFPCKVTPRRGSEKLFKLIDSEEDMAVKQSQFVSDREILQKLMDSRPWDM
jgi:hypothetical protein